MDKKRDGHAIVSNVIKSLEKGGFFSPSDREKFARVGREHGIEGSVIEEVIDMGQTISLIHRHEDWLDASDLPREQKKAMRTELQKSIDENLEALRKIKNSLFFTNLMRSTRSMFPLLYHQVCTKLWKSLIIIIIKMGQDKGEDMPLPFILGGLALAAAGYGFKKSIDALDADCEADEFIKKAESLKEGAKNRVELAQSDCKNALMRLGEKKFHVISRGVSRFVEHFNQLKGHQFFVKDSDMQDLHKQVSVAQNFSKQLNASGMSEESAIGGMFAGYGGLCVSSWTTGAMLGGGLTMGGLAGMAVFGGLVAGPALAILGALSADEMEEKLEKAKAYHSQVEVAVKKADAAIDNLRAVEEMAKSFTRQITKCDALFFSLSQDAIATMKKHNYDTSRYNQEEKDQLCVTVSTLSSLSAFLKVPIIDEHQKLNKKAQNALNLMRNQMNDLESGQESGHYDVAMIQSNQKGLKNL